MQVCTACMILSLLTCLNLNTPPLARVKRGSTTGPKTQQACLPADYGLYSSTFPSLVNCILTIPECRSDHHGRVHTQHRPGQSVCSLSSSPILGLLKVLRQFPTWRQLFICTDRSRYMFIPILCTYAPRLQTLRQIPSSACYHHLVVECGIHGL